MKLKLLLSLGTALTATFSIPFVAAKCGEGDKKEEVRKPKEEPAKPVDNSKNNDSSNEMGGKTNLGNSANSSNSSSQNNLLGAEANTENLPAPRDLNHESLVAPISNEKRIKTTLENSKKDGEKVDEKQKATYKDIDFDISQVKITIDKKDLKDEDLISPKKGNNKQLFISSFKGETKVSGKFEKGQKPWDGISIGSVIGLPKDYSISNADSPLYTSKKGRKNSVKSNGFINVEKDGSNLKIKFRFYKFNKGGNSTVSTKVYEAIIS
ncbi:P30, predicted lipoprotein [Mycoplasmopsis agalactiae 14628]|uniref:p30, predicted lipoprotein n=1 Tax=Mycoplasmopsis agalactiae 14628 TaxID=1110504 RepID=I5D516_MYCAA|nr:variable surface lipoprotein [Mycoplasmopsis agalactiae]EIN14775.1 P30, predicted lipoprotein [Mycoplasmopsis agalactiae 14628]